MKQNFKSHSIVVIAAVFILVILLLMSCSPAATPVPQAIPVTGAQPEVVVPTIAPTEAPKPVTKNPVLVLPDGSKIILWPDTKAEVVKYPLTEKESDIEINLSQGELLVIPDLESGNQFTVKSPEGAIARLNGCAMIVTMDVVDQAFGLVCVGGNCSMGKSEADLFTVQNDESWLYKNKQFVGPATINLVDLQKAYNDYLPVCPLSIPVTGGQITETPRPTPNIAASATASCSDFKRKFPGTPCP